MPSSGPESGSANHKATRAGTAKPTKARPETQLRGRMRPAMRTSPARIGRNVAV
ncbi:MAG: hypothetical protein RIR91_844, partial [Verrucomicrobiota bacterium]